MAEKTDIINWGGVPSIVVNNANSGGFTRIEQKNSTLSGGGYM